MTRLYKRREDIQEYMANNFSDIRISIEFWQHMLLPSFLQFCKVLAYGFMIWAWSQLQRWRLYVNKTRQSRLIKVIKELSTRNQTNLHRAHFLQMKECAERISEMNSKSEKATTAASLVLFLHHIFYPSTSRWG